MAASEKTEIRESQRYCVVLRCVKLLTRDARKIETCKKPEREHQGGDKQCNLPRQNPDS